MDFVGIPSIQRASLRQGPVRAVVVCVVCLSWLWPDCLRSFPIAHDLHTSEWCGPSVLKIVHELECVLLSHNKTVGRLEGRSSQGSPSEDVSGHQVQEG